MADLHLPRDPQGIEEPHDVLAAEEFAMPAHSDLRERGLALPRDPTGIAEAHDILAAEEFAMPAGPDQPHADAQRGDRRAVLLALAAAALLAALYAALRRR